MDGVRKMSESEFCPNCGKLIKPNDEFCPNCGARIAAQKKSRQEYRAKEGTQKSTSVPKKELATTDNHQPMKKKNKIIFSCLGILVVAFIAFYAWGSNHYQRQNQVDQITAYLKNPHENMAQYVTADNPAVHVTNAALKPTQNYYFSHSRAADQMGEALKYSDSYDNVSLVQSGRYLLFFPKYTLKFETFSPQIKTNHANSTIYVNGKKVGGVNGSGEEYYKKTDPLFPGKYHIIVKSVASGHNLAAEKTANIFSNDAINMNIKTVNFMIESVAGADIYINDKKAGTVGKDGTKDFRDYPATDDMKIYVVIKVGGHEIKSKVIDYDELGFDDDDDSSSNVIKPEWPGLISQDDAESMLQNAFNSPDEDDFVGGAENKGYQELHGQVGNFNDDDDIIEYDMECNVVSVSPAPGNCSNVVYKITYTFEHDDYEHKQVMLYSGAVFHQDGDESDSQKIKSIGSGKIISDKKYNN